LDIGDTLCGIAFSLKKHNKDIDDEFIPMNFHNKYLCLAEICKDLHNIVTSNFTLKDLCKKAIHKLHLKESELEKLSISMQDYLKSS
jgi:hypothetical protein